MQTSLIFSAFVSTPPEVTLRRDAGSVPLELKLSRSLVVYLDRDAAAYVAELLADAVAKLDAQPPEPSRIGSGRWFAEQLPLSEPLSGS